ncbi:tumor necrosis factor receptor superfamily member 10A [Equus caballus]|uniref:tumor necrosis factor receptor superfamily member 10A n=1 Tax=Equus caballus TaxID=9796 RepID=UPI0038B2E370
MVNPRGRYTDEFLQGDCQISASGKPSGGRNSERSLTSRGSGDPAPWPPRAPRQGARQVPGRRGAPGPLSSSSWVSCCRSQLPQPRPPSRTEFTAISCPSGKCSPWEGCVHQDPMCQKTVEIVHRAQMERVTQSFRRLPCLLTLYDLQSGEQERSKCTGTRETECWCKRGTFHGEDFPEVCQTCSSRCPDGMVEAGPCTPWSDLKCVHQGSGNPWPVIGIVAVAVAVAVLLLGLTVYLYRRRILQGCEVAANCINRVFFWRSCPPRGPEALDNAYNKTLNNRESSSTLASEQELEGQEQAEPTGVSAQSPGEAECLLGPAGAEGSQMRRRLLVPANGADPTEKAVHAADEPHGQ